MYLAFGVASPGVDVPCGGQGQRVLSTNGDVLDEDPGQQWHLLWPVVVAGTALGQPNQAICKGKHQAPGASSTQGEFHYRHRQGRDKQQICTVLGLGHKGNPLGTKGMAVHCKLALPTVLVPTAKAVVYVVSQKQDQILLNQGL